MDREKDKAEDETRPRKDEGSEDELEEARSPLDRADRSGGVGGATGVNKTQQRPGR